MRDLSAVQALPVLMVLGWGLEEMEGGREMELAHDLGQCALRNTVKGCALINPFNPFNQNTVPEY